MNTDKWMSFDCYGTLIDWRTGLLAALEQASPGNAQPLLELHRTVEDEIQEGGSYRPYRQVLRESLHEMARRAGVTITPGTEDVLAQTLPTWPPYDDTVEALAGLRDDGWKLAILTNVDDDLIAPTLEAMGVPIDHLITAQTVRSYKPAPAHVDRLLADTGLDPRRWVHAAVALRHDLIPAKERGAVTAWVNRDAEELYGPEPDIHVRRVADLQSSLEEIVRSW